LIESWQFLCWRNPTTELVHNIAVCYSKDYLVDASQENRVRGTCQSAPENYEMRLVQYATGRALSVRIRVFEAVGCCDQPAQHRGVRLHNFVSIPPSLSDDCVEKCVPDTSHRSAHRNCLAILGFDRCSALGSGNVETLPGDGSTVDFAIHGAIIVLIAVFVLLSSAIYNNQHRACRKLSIPEQPRPYICLAR
jgi:hypothetical protein